MHPPCDRGTLSVERLAHGSRKFAGNRLSNRQQQLTTTPRAYGGVSRTTCGQYLTYGPCRRNEPSPVGQGRVLIGTDREPVALVWGMVDDLLVHATTRPKCHKAFSAFMDHSVRLGIKYPKTTTSPPAQIQKFCGLLYDSTTVPCVRITEAKISRSLATIEYVVKQAR